MNFSKLFATLLLGCGVLVSSFSLYAANPPSAPIRPPRTNAPAMTGPGARTNPAVGLPKTGPAAKESTPGQGPTDLMGRLQRYLEHPAFYPVVGGVFIGVIVLLLVQRGRAKKSPKSAAVTPSGRTVKRAGGKAHTCTVLRVQPEARQVWVFDARSARFNLARQQTVKGTDPLPGSLVQKDWTTLWQRKLNIAWLPADQVFLRVAHLPVSDFNETLSMVEFQLEKLSPMPVAQIVWSLHILPQVQDKMQTVIVMMVARSVVEEFLGRLEGQGYLADRLDLSLLDQLLSTNITEDGAWIYPDLGGNHDSAVVAWWYKGVLRNINLVRLSGENPGENLKEQLLQMAWAGEMEGWLTSAPQWHLVADAEAAARWEAALRTGLEQPVVPVAPLPPPQLAALTARRAATDETQGNLLPAEFSTRYQQQFVDRLWMRGLGAVLAVYLVGVLIYFVALQFATYRTTKVEDSVAALGGSYTNALQAEARYQILKDRQELKYAALDCWSAAARLMPETLTLDSFNFSDGKRLTLSGSAPSDQVTQLIEFEAALRKATRNGQPLFNPNKGDNLSYHANPAASMVSWNFGLELNRVEVQ
ncbi:MAG TPA: hypothetical protein VN673_06320 [Clostridia bacterium]|nr:hypothetical protein [Clostridia bacterium]